MLLGAEITHVEGRSGEPVRVSVATDNGGRVVEATDLLIAAGRTPNTQGIGVELAGIELDARGYISVNERLETTAPGVWAVGDCAGSPQFTHVAYDDFRIVRDNLSGGNRTNRNRLVPFCMFTDPELARVGLNESEAKNRGIEYRLAKMPMAAVLRTQTLSEPRGFIKMLIDKANDQILGFTVFGAEGSELMATVQTAMLGQLPFTVLRDAIFTHPTAAEGLTVLLADVAGLIAVRRHSKSQCDVVRRLVISAIRLGGSNDRADSLDGTRCHMLVLASARDGDSPHGEAIGISPSCIRGLRSRLCRWQCRRDAPGCDARRDTPGCAQWMASRHHFAACGAGDVLVAPKARAAAHANFAVRCRWSRAVCCLRHGEGTRVRTRSARGGDTRNAHRNRGRRAS